MSRLKRCAQAFMCVSIFSNVLRRTTSVSAVSFTVIASLAFLFFCQADVAHGTPMLAYEPFPQIGGVSGCAINQATCGFGFIVTEPVEVTALGFVDLGRDGWTSGPANVGVWDLNTEVLLASASIEPTDTLFGDYRYTTIDPLFLLPTLEYVLGGKGAEGFAAENGANSTFFFAPEVQPLGNGRFCPRNFVSTLCFPSMDNLSRGEWGFANFLSPDLSPPIITPPPFPVSEPSTLSLFLMEFLPMVLFLGWRRLRNRILKNRAQ